MDTSSATIAAAGGVGAGGDAPLSAGELAPYQYLFLTGKGGVGKCRARWRAPSRTRGGACCW